MSWGKEWPPHTGKAIADRQAEDKEVLNWRNASQKLKEATTIIGIDLGNGADETVLVTGEIEDGKLYIQEFYKGKEAEAKLEDMFDVAEPVFLTKEEFQKIYPSNAYGKFSSDTKVYQNKVPTHDPYTNPDAHIYYQCNCGAVLDPGTKSFAALNNAAMNAGWKIRFGHEYYIPYCVKCGEGVE